MYKYYSRASRSRLVRYDDFSRVGGQWVTSTRPMMYCSLELKPHGNGGAESEIDIRSVDGQDATPGTIYVIRLAQ